MKTARFFNRILTAALPSRNERAARLEVLERMQTAFALAFFAQLPSGKVSPFSRNSTAE